MTPGVLGVLATACVRGTACRTGAGRTFVKPSEWTKYLTDNACPFLSLVTSRAVGASCCITGASRLPQISQRMAICSCLRGPAEMFATFCPVEKGCYNTMLKLKLGQVKILPVKKLVKNLLGKNTSKIDKVI